MRTVDFAYAGARIQARYGTLVSAAQWERLQRLEGVDAFLQAARDTGLRPWVLQVDPKADAHQFEAHLRLLFRRRVSELAGWAPAAWRPAIEWTSVLPDLPAITHRLRDGAPAPWMATDARLAEELKLLQPAKGAALEPLADWLARWRALWPATLPGERAGLEALIRLVRVTLGKARADTPGALAALRRPLHRLFRRHTRAPAGLFVYLVLAWLEMVAVRGALLRRRLALPIEGVAA